jgi:hypothetical protein
MARAACCTTRAVSAGEACWSIGCSSSCTAEISACLSCGACCSTYIANSASLARRTSGSTSQRTVAAITMP